MRGNETIGECVTDNFGDFKFDNLEENSGAYTLRIVYAGYGTKTVEVESDPERLRGNDLSLKTGHGARVKVEDKEVK